jgi:hypothetical protein
MRLLTLGSTLQHASAVLLLPLVVLQAADKVRRGGRWLEVLVPGGEARAAAQGLRRILIRQQRKCQQCGTALLCVQL